MMHDTLSDDVVVIWLSYSSILIDFLTIMQLRKVPVGDFT
jgi:hypothetical protein